MNRPMIFAEPLPRGTSLFSVVPPRNLALDGLRGIAVLAVLAYHFWPQALPGGFLGVDLFFVLSGFLITGGLLRQMQSQRIPPLRTFWVRRARRLLPAMLLVLVCSTALALLAAENLPAGLRWQWFGALTYSSNWMQIAHGNSYFASMDPPYFQHLWSLAVEEQFYLVWPLALAGLAWVLRTRRNLMWGIVLLAVASAASMFWGFEPATDPSVLYFGTWTHGFGLLFGSAGAVAAERMKSRARQPGLRTGKLAGLAQVFLLVIMLAAVGLLPDTSAVAYQGGMALFCALGTLLILLLQVPGGFVDALLSLKLLRWFGNRSYGLYLWHWPLLMLAKTVFPPQAATAAVLCTVPLVLLAAELSWRFVEVPILANGWRSTAAESAKRVSTKISEFWNGTSGSFASLLPLTALILVPACSMAVLLASPGESPLEQQLTQAQKILAEQPSQPAPAEKSTEEGSGKTATGKKTDMAQGEHAARTLTGRDVTALGDSVMLASSQQLLKQLPGISIEANVGAQIWDAPARLRELKSAGSLRHVVVLGLGTNGDVSGVTLKEVREIIGPKRELMLITAYAPRRWIDSANTQLRAAAAADPKTHVVDWAATAPTIDDLARDRIHPGPHGSAAYGKLLAEAVAAL
ncbi:acyltransferase family protein [Glutamicibacter sp. NPDC087344]|uniref:acyltransferase family protein n=1 Tax=Glutamicibacter sp. NPDC087344 TaxID=3363994 RepID=UPI0038180255